MVVCTLCPTVSGWRSQRQPTPPPPLPSFFPPTTGRTANTNYLIAICVTRNTSHKQVKTQNRIIQRLLVAVLDGCVRSAEGPMNPRRPRWCPAHWKASTGPWWITHIGLFGGLFSKCSQDWQLCMHMHTQADNGHQVIKHRPHNAPRGKDILLREIYFVISPPGKEVIKKTNQFCSHIDSS